MLAGGREACRLADTLRTVRTGWDGSTRDGAAACGLPVAAAAYRAMQDAWFDEVGVHITVLEEICAALRASAISFPVTERGEAERFGRGAGGDR